MISVCMASYNGEKYIRRQVESILCQLGRDDEVIVSDDCSTDNTRQILAEIGDPRVNVIDGPRKGIAANFENAIRASKGEVLFLSDQDDRWLPGKVEKVMQAFLETDALVIHHDARVVDSCGNELMPSYCAWRGIRHGVLKNIVKTSYLGCCMAFKREILADLLPICNFRSGVFAHDDWVGLVGELNGGVHFLDQILMCYYRHGGNFSSLGQRTIRWRVARRLIMLAMVFRYIARRTWRKRFGRKQSQVQFVLPKL